MSLHSSCIFLFSLIFIILLLDTTKSESDGHPSSWQEQNDATATKIRKNLLLRLLTKRETNPLPTLDGIASVVPPSVNQSALMARFIVNQNEWASVATISTQNDIRNYPFANLISVSDGLLGNGCGIPYMYLTSLDFTGSDLTSDNRATLMMSLAEGPYCKTEGMDPMDPRCPRVILTGRILKVPDSEIDVAKSAVFGRHPWLAKMPVFHHFYFAKLEIKTIFVLDSFGGAKSVSLKDYMNPPTMRNEEERNDDETENMVL